MNWIAVVKSYWKELTIVGSLIALGLLTSSYLAERNQRVLAQTETQNAKVEFKTFQNGVTQAQNDLVKTHKEMVEKLSQEMQEEIRKQNTRVLTTVRGEIQAGFTNVVDAVGKVDPNLPIYSYGDKVQDIKVDATVPTTPKFSYAIKPFTIGLEGVLNFDEKNGQTKFWFHPQVKTDNGMSINTTALVLTPGPEFNQWVSKLKGKEVYVPTMPKWTVSGMVGRETLKELPGGFRVVYGAEATRNFQNNLGFGAGFLGSTSYVKVSYSFGKQ